MSEESDNSGQEHPAKRHMDKALQLVSGARREKYGPPERNFERIAVLWHAYLECVQDAADGKIRIRALDVCHMLDLVKLARLIETPNHEDSITDRFGYQACYVDLVVKQPNEEPAAAAAAASEEWIDWPPAEPWRGIGRFTGL